MGVFAAAAADVLLCDRAGEVRHPLEPLIWVLGVFLFENARGEMAGVDGRKDIILLAYSMVRLESE